MGRGTAAPENSFCEDKRAGYFLVTLGTFLYLWVHLVLLGNILLLGQGTAAPEDSLCENKWAWYFFGYNWYFLALLGTFSIFGYLLKLLVVFCSRHNLLLYLNAHYVRIRGLCTYWYIWYLGNLCYLVVRLAVLPFCVHVCPNFHVCVVL